jgi:glutathione synthase/RimK-type ligase-like ATP-grasp enzyme
VKNTINVLGIYREKKYSNRAVEADKKILDELMTYLQFQFQFNINLKVVQPEDFIIPKEDYDLVFSMSQEDRILNWLDLLEKRGAVIVNTSRSIRNCYRKNLSIILSDKIFSYPKSQALNVKEKSPLIYFSESGYWVKRADFHALDDNDVVHIDSKEQLEVVLNEFESRNVSEVILQEHFDGELFKFYGIRNSFFTIRHMGKTTINRYNFLEGDHKPLFDCAKMEKLANQAAELLELDFFGGDCIVTESGQYHLIDFNDWPSFRTCVKDATPKMIEYALNKFKNEADNVSNAY